MIDDGTLNRACLSLLYIHDTHWPPASQITFDLFHVFGIRDINLARAHDDMMPPLFGNRIGSAPVVATFDRFHGFNVDTNLIK